MLDKFIHFWFAGFIAWAILSVVSLLILTAIVLYEKNKYPVCKKCGTKRHTTKKNKEGKFICSIHGEINTS